VLRKLRGEDPGFDEKTHTVLRKLGPVLRALISKLRLLLKGLGLCRENSDCAEKHRLC
jgi:hypothetical protein